MFGFALAPFVKPQHVLRPASYFLMAADSCDNFGINGLENKVFGLFAFKNDLLGSCNPFMITAVLLNFLQPTNS